MEQTELFMKYRRYRSPSSWREFKPELIFWCIVSAVFLLSMIDIKPFLQSLDTLGYIEYNARLMRPYENLRMAVQFVILPALLMGGVVLEILAEVIPSSFYAESACVTFKNALSRKVTIYYSQIEEMKVYNTYQVKRGRHGSIVARFYVEYIEFTTTEGSYTFKNIMDAHAGKYIDAPDWMEILFAAGKFKALERFILEQKARLPEVENVWQ